MSLGAMGRKMGGEANKPFLALKIKAHSTPAIVETGSVGRPI